VSLERRSVTEKRLGFSSLTTAILVEILAGRELTSLQNLLRVSLLFPYALPTLTRMQGSWIPTSSKKSASFPRLVFVSSTTSEIWLPRKWVFPTKKKRRDLLKERKFEITSIFSCSRESS
jgi:hypothetical protein